MLQTKIFAFIGTGNMGGAMALAAGQAVPGERLLLCNRTPEKAERLAGQTGGRVVDAHTAAASADYLFLGVKPQMMAGVLADLRETLLSREKPCALVSMAAGLSISDIRRLSGVDFPIIRIMPNIPCAVGEGIVLWCSDGADDETLADFETAMAGAGMLDRVDEGLIDAGSVVAGCGPAFAAMLVEALADGGVACGLPRARAQAYAAQMLKGTAALLLKDGRHPGQLKDAVCSPGGSTIQGVRALESGGFRAAAFEAVTAAYVKTLKMGGKEIT